MRKLLMLLFLVLTVVLAAYAYVEFTTTSSSLPDFDKKESDVRDNGEGKIAEVEPDAMRRSAPIEAGVEALRTASPEFSLTTPAPDKLNAEFEKLVEEATQVRKENIDQAHFYDGFAHNLGWVGSICSWLILGITVFLENAKGDAKPQADGKPRALKSNVIGLLAVGAAVCPLSVVKLEKNKSFHADRASIIREKMTESKLKFPATPDFEKQKLIDELFDAIHIETLGVERA